MKKRILISLSGAFVLVALAIFVIAQTSGTSLVSTEKSSGCGDTEVVMTAASSEGCCSSSSAAVMTADMKSDDCTSVAEAAVSAGCTGVTQAAAAAGCTGVSAVNKSAGCGSSKSTEQVSKVMVSNEVEAACCEGSATAALLIDECCGSCI